MVLRSISHRRCGVLLGLMLVRFSLAVGMMVLGCRWLAATTELESLLLNAAALSFVFELDDLLIGAFGPHGIRSLIRRMQPCRWQHV